MNKRDSNPEVYRRAEDEVVRIQEGMIGVTARFLPKFPVTPADIGNSRGADGIFEKGTRSALETLVYMAQHYDCVDPRKMTRDLDEKNLARIGKLLESRGMKSDDEDFKKIQNGLAALRIDRGLDGKEKPLLHQVYTQYLASVKPSDVVLPQALHAAIPTPPPKGQQIVLNGAFAKAATSVKPIKMTFGEYLAALAQGKDASDPKLAAYDKAYKAELVKRDFHALSGDVSKAADEATASGNYKTYIVLKDRMAALEQEIKRTPLALTLSTKDENPDRTSPVRLNTTGTQVASSVVRP